MWHEEHMDARQVGVFEFADDGTIGRATFIYEDPDEYEAFWSD